MMSKETKVAENPIWTGEELGNKPSSVSPSPAGSSKQRIHDDTLDENRKEVGMQQPKETSAIEAGNDMFKVFSEKEVNDIRAMMNVKTSVNPFFHQDEFNACERLKMVLGIVLIPIRILLISLVVLVMWFFIFIGTSCCYNPDKPVSYPRKLFIHPLQPLGRLILLIMGVVRIKVIGKRAKKVDAPVLIAAPHSTAIDALVLGSLVGPFSGFAKAEVSKVPFVGNMGRFVQTVWVDRSSAEKKKKSLQVYTHRVQKLVNNEENWNSFVTFPEGTCTNRKSLITFKRGAFVPGAPCQLALFKWANRQGFGCGSFDPTWTSSGPNRGYMFLRLLSQIFTTLTVEFSEVIIPTEEEKVDSVLYASRVREVAAEILKLPMSEHSYPDTFLSHYCKKLKVKADKVCNFEFQDLIELNLNRAVDDKLDFSLAAGKRLLKKFALSLPEGEIRKQGLMNLNQFANSLNMAVTKPVSAVFNCIDKDVQGSIDFKGYFVVLSYIVSITEAAIESEGLSIEKVIEKMRSIEDEKIAKKWQQFEARRSKATKIEKDGTDKTVAYLANNQEELFLYFQLIKLYAA